MNLSPLAKCAVLIGTLLASTPARSDCPDLALVLAIDASSSVNKQEYALQMQGYAAALASAEVQRALQAAGRVKIGVVLWGDGAMPVQVLPLRPTSKGWEAAALGEAMVTVPRRMAGNTGLGRGLAEALQLLDAGAPCAVRRVIDVSGDGKESFSPRARDRIPVGVVRERAEAMGITINGLAVTNEHGDIADYYRSQVITGPDAFVEEVRGYEDFAAAILRKLVREIAPPALAGLAPAVTRRSDL